MTRSEFYVAMAHEGLALADNAHDPASKRMLEQAAGCWELLAGLEENVDDALESLRSRGR